MARGVSQGVQGTSGAAAGVQGASDAAAAACAHLFLEPRVLQHLANLGAALWVDLEQQAYELDRRWRDRAPHRLLKVEASARHVAVEVEGAPPRVLAANLR